MSSYNGKNRFAPRIIVPARPFEPVDMEFMLGTTPRVATGYQNINDPNTRTLVREVFGFPYSGLVPLPMLVDDILFDRSPRDVALLMIAWKKAAGSCFSAAVRCKLTCRSGQLFETAIDKVDRLDSEVRTEIDLNYAELVYSSG